MPVHERSLIIAAAVFVLFAPAHGYAHGGGPLDANGCHYDHRLHDYHCHTGKLRGKHFKSRADMLKMLKTGEDTSISSKHPGHFQDLVKTVTGKKSGSTGQATAAKQAPAAQNTSPAPAGGTTAAGSGTADSVAADSGTADSVAAANGQPAAVSSAAARVSLEDRLSVLKRLYEKDLITKREYDKKRQQLLDSL